MYNSLQRIASLPDETILCPGHDYTEEDLRFALKYESDNMTVKKCLADLRANPKSAYTSTIAREKQTNPFLRANQPQIKKALKMQNATATQTFTRLRHEKDTF